MKHKPMTMGFMQWLVATVVAAIMMTASVLVFAYSNFETTSDGLRKESSIKDRLAAIESKIERIDSKVDQLLLQRR